MDKLCWNCHDHFCLFLSKEKIGNIAALLKKSGDALHVTLAERHLLLVI
jgi:hypothetical protein